MMRNILVTRPIHEKVVAYLSAHAESTFNTAKQKGFTVKDLLGEKATKRNVESFISKQAPEFIFFNGHGSETQIAGHNDEPLITNKENVALLYNKITYALACKSASELGRDCVKNKNTAFVGYEEDFMFFMDGRRIATPLKDGYVKSIFSASNLFVNSILKGNSVKQAYDKSQYEFKQQIRRLKCSKEPEAPYILQALVWDMFWQRALGDLTLSL